MTTETQNVTAAGRDEAKRIRALVRENAAPEGFGSFELQFGEDWTGDPAVWVRFAIDPDYPTDKKSIEKLTRLELRVISALLRAQIDHYPYVRFQEKTR